MHAAAVAAGGELLGSRLLGSHQGSYVEAVAAGQGVHHSIYGITGAAERNNRRS
jgi:hypothetical protein